MTKLATGVFAALLMTTSPVLAASITENFDGENGGASAPNYTGFSQFDVTDGSASLVHSGNSGVSCAGGSGSCVNLDGSSSIFGDTLTTKTALSFKSGDLVTLSFDLSGNQRGGSDDLSAGFLFSESTAINDFALSGAYGNFDVGSFTTTSAGWGIIKNAFSPFQNYVLSFTAAQAGTVNGYINSSNGSGFGPVFDNFRLTVDGVADVPEPATWALMVVGMGMVGYAMRRHRAVLAA